MSSLALYLLNSEECSTLSERLLKIFKTDLSGDNIVIKVLPYLEKLNNDLTAIMARTGSADITREIVEKDEVRDVAFMTFRDYCKAYTGMPDPKQAAAAEALTGLIQKLGWTLYSEGYTEQTAALQGLFEALDKPKYVQAVAAINASTLLTHLQAVHADFEAAVAQRAEITATQEEIPPTSECKQRMNRYLKPLLYYIGLMADIDSATYANTHTKITKAIEDIMTVAKARRTRNENQQAETAEQEGESS